MAVSANYDFNPEINTILTMGLRLAGLVQNGKPASAVQLSGARDFLDALLKDLKNGAVMLSHLETITQTLTIGQAAYVLAADTVEVSAPMMILGPNDTTQTEATPIAFSQYQETVDKQTTGRPISYYIEKTAVVTVYFWPVPDAAYVASFRRQRLMRNADAGTTLDATAGWLRGISYQIAADMGRCGSMDLATISDRQKMADKLLERAESKEVENLDLQMVLPDLR